MSETAVFNLVYYHGDFPCTSSRVENNQVAHPQDVRGYQSAVVSSAVTGYWYPRFLLLFLGLQHITVVVWFYVTSAEKIRVVPTSQNDIL